MPRVRIGANIKTGKMDKPKVYIGASENKKQNNPVVLIGLAAIALVVGWIVSQRFVEDPVGASMRESAAEIDASLAELKQAPSSASTGQITYADYSAIEIGSSLADVEAILGKGTELSRAESKSVPSAVTYSWVNADGSSVIALFSGGFVEVKSQVGLN